MSAPDIIAIVVSLCVIGAAALYIIKEKKKGNHCIGCPDASSCPHKGCCHKSQETNK